VGLESSGGGGVGEDYVGEAVGERSGFDGWVQWELGVFSVTVSVVCIIVMVMVGISAKIVVWLSGELGDDFGPELVQWTNVLADRWV